MSRHDESINKATQPDIPPLTLERLRADVARVLDVEPGEILDTDNLVDFGLDSIRLMTLAQQWREAGAAVPFAELAERPELRHWWMLVTSRMAQA